MGKKSKKNQGKKQSPDNKNSSAAEAKRQARSAKRASAGNSVEESEVAAFTYAASLLHPEVVHGARVPDTFTSAPTSTSESRESFVLQTQAVTGGSGNELALVVCPRPTVHYQYAATYAAGVVATVTSANASNNASYAANFLSGRCVSLSISVAAEGPALQMEGYCTGYLNKYVSLVGQSQATQGGGPEVMRTELTPDKPTFRLLWKPTSSLDSSMLAPATSTSTETCLYLFVSSITAMRVRIDIVANWEWEPTQVARNLFNTDSIIADPSTAARAVQKATDIVESKQDTAANTDKAYDAVQKDLRALGEAVMSGNPGAVVSSILSSNTVRAGGRWLLSGVSQWFGPAREAQRVFMALAAIEPRELAALDRLLAEGGVSSQDNPVPALARFLALRPHIATVARGVHLPHIAGPGGVRRALVRYEPYGISPFPSGDDWVHLREGH